MDYERIINTNLELDYEEREYMTLHFYNIFLGKEKYTHKKRNMKEKNHYYNPLIL